MVVLEPDFFLTCLTNFVRNQKIKGLTIKSCGTPDQGESPHRYGGSKLIRYNHNKYYIHTQMELVNGSYDRFHGVELYRSQLNNKLKWTYEFVGFVRVSSNNQFKTALSESNDEFQAVKEACSTLVVIVFNMLRQALKEDFKK